MSEQRSVLRLASPVWSGAAVAAMLIAVLGAQHLRHGWPFSLHHRVPEATVPMSAAVAESDAALARAVVDFAPDRLASAGVALEAARMESITQPLRAAATVVPDEARISHLHTRIAGWIEAIYVTTTGEQVRAGQPLVGIFSQDLYASQSEYLAARQAASSGPSSAIVAGARSRLAVLGMNETEIREIERRGTARRLVTLSAPRGGVVLRRPIAVGSAVDPSTEIVTIADLSRVWIIAEVPESESAAIRPGVTARIEFRSAGLPPVEAQVQFVAPTLTERTRTLRVRFGVDNPGGVLRPGTYGTAEFSVAPRWVVTVPRDAVVDTGDRQHVFVATSSGRLEPRTVTLGARLADRVEVRSGLAADESVVAAGVFLVDSESRLRASGAATHAHGAPKPPAESPHRNH